ncbi:MAG TPA: acyl-CoA dehydrogenase family protein [Gemmatimonadales bacterium]|nr:acyl-CoA dehydrogenase family protein [Gemmatimonadales bacterium]
MDFSWTDEQLKLRAAVIDFARQTLNQDFAAREKDAHFSRELWRECAQFGIQGLPVPEEFGGAAQDVVTTMLAMEALGYACLDQGLLFSLHAQMWAIQTPILRFGSDQQKQKYLPKLCDGSIIGAHAMSEPDTGTDAFALGTRAEKKGDRYILNGSKTFVTNAPVGDLFLVFATVDKKKGMWGITGFLVERGTKGLSTGGKLEKLGLTTSPTGEVFLEDCEVPAEAMIGKVGQGATIFNHSMAWERSCILGSVVGAMERELEICVDYAKTRKQFGKPIGNFQLVAGKLSEMKVRLETSRLLLYRAAWAHGRGEPNALEGAIAKLAISEAAVQSSLDAIQIHGGYGYMREYQVERHLRDNVSSRLYSGTSEIQRLIIARHLGLNPGA